MPLSTGEKLGPYEILSTIGAGGMGEVYKANDTRLDRTVPPPPFGAAFSEQILPGESGGQARLKQGALARPGKRRAPCTFSSASRCSGRRPTSVFHGALANEHAVRRPASDGAKRQPCSRAAGRAGPRPQRSRGATSSSWWSGAQPHPHAGGRGDGRRAAGAGTGGRHRGAGRARLGSVRIRRDSGGNTPANVSSYSRRPDNSTCHHKIGKVTDGHRLAGSSPRSIALEESCLE
jgi:hypothetical protein